MGTAYNNPFKIKFDKYYPIDIVVDGIYKLFGIFPVFKSCVVENHSFEFDAEPEIVIKPIENNEFIVKPFKLDEYLSRFLIIEDNGESNCIYMDCHHLIFDGTSLNIILKRFMEILEGHDVEKIDDGILRQIAFEKSISVSNMNDAEKFFDKLLMDNDDVFELLPSLDSNDSIQNEYWDELIINNEYLNSFLNNHNITLNQFLASVFAYTLSRFTGSSRILFNLIENGRGNIDLSDSMGMFVRTLPLIIDCKNHSIRSFLRGKSISCWSITCT